MKQCILAVVGALAVTLCVQSAVVAQVSSGNGYLGYRVTNAGAVSTMLYPYVHANRDIGRLVGIGAISQNSVFDYNEDFQPIGTATALTIPGVDDAAEGLSDGSYIGMFPKLRVRSTLMTWTDAGYLVVRIRFYNDSTDAIPMYLGAVVVPRPSALYGYETVAWDTASQTAYFFRTGETPYWGIRLLRRPTYSFKVLDWDTYSPLDPNNDVATDSTRYDMTATLGFDSSLTAGPNGSILSVNRGLVTVGPGDSADIEYAIAYGTSPEEVVTVCDSCEVRYENLLVSVSERGAGGVPSLMTLHQNYPNPFNPETEIRFDVTTEAFVTLRVYSVIGQEVATLVRQQMSPGSYGVHFSGAALPSGVYYYRLEAGTFVATRAMTLVK